MPLVSNPNNLPISSVPTTLNPGGWNAKPFSVIPSSTPKAYTFGYMFLNVAPSDTLITQAGYGASGYRLQLWATFDMSKPNSWYFETRHPLLSDRLVDLLSWMISIELAAYFVLVLYLLYCNVFLKHRHISALLPIDLTIAWRSILWQYFTFCLRWNQCSSF